MNSPTPSPSVEATASSLKAAEKLARLESLRHRTEPVAVTAVSGQMRFAVDKIMGEAGLYAPTYAALAMKQTEGDLHEAVCLLRALRQSLPRRYTSETIDTRSMFVLRRISSAFREIPGGQILGPTLDYSQRLLEAKLAHETLEDQAKTLQEMNEPNPGATTSPVRSFGKVTDLLRQEGLLKPAQEDEDLRLVDLTREPLLFPAPRSARLQALARAETGAIMALAYSGMRGQGGDHPTIGEVRYGRVTVTVLDSRGRQRKIGRIQVTEAENISKIKVKKKDPVPYLSLGYGLCFGQNETKAICMGILDRSMRIGGDSAPAISQEFVLYHCDGADAWGSVTSERLPAHVEFLSDLDLIRAARARSLRRQNDKNEDQANTLSSTRS